MLLVKRLNEKDKNGKYKYLFKCPACDSEVIKQLSNGKRDKTCGCVLTPRRTITKENKRIHQCWTNMKTRCNNSNYKKSHRYKERGITVCKEWENFTNFLKWSVSSGYKENLTLDRIDNDKGYSPDNCRWVTNTENIRNSSATKLNKDKILLIKKLRKENVSTKEISIMFSISQRQVYNIINDRHWREEYSERINLVVKK